MTLLEGLILNMFCPTGPGGGVNPSCGAGGKPAGGGMTPQQRAEVSAAATSLSEATKGGGKLPGGSKDLGKEAIEQARKARMWGQQAASNPSKSNDASASVAHDNAARNHSLAAQNIREGKGGIKKTDREPEAQKHEQAAEAHKAAGRLYHEEQQRVTPFRAQSVEEQG